MRGRTTRVGGTVRQAGFGWVFAFALGIVVSLAIGAAQPPTVTLHGPSRAQWVEISHESGAKYLIKESSIIGFYQSNDPKLENEVIVAGAKSVHTSLSFELFGELMQSLVGEYVPPVDKGTGGNK